MSSEVRSSASRPVAVTSSTGVRAASAAAMNGRAGFGATMSKAADPMDSITGCERGICEGDLGESSERSLGRGQGSQRTRS